MVKYMSYKNDPFEKEINKIYNKSKINYINFFLVYIPSFICVGIFIIIPTELMFMITSFMLFLGITLNFGMILRNVIGKDIAKEIRSIKMHTNDSYKSKIKILSFYNTKYDYKPVFINMLKFYILFVIITSIIFYIIFRNIDEQTFEYLLHCLLTGLFLIPFIAFFVLKNISENVDINKLIKDKFKPDIINEKTIEPLLNSKLYPYIQGKEEYIEEIKKGFSYSKYISDDIINKTNIYCNDYLYDLKYYKMYLYNVANFDSGEKSSTNVKEERTILFEFRKESIFYEIKIVNTELNAIYETDIPYKIEIGNAFLTQESLRILNEICKRDVVDIYCNNGYVYIKKYIPKIVDKSDIDEYATSIELYIKFVDALM